ncbi:MAG: type II secretion system protein, partial [Planctomycetota bacterium]
LLVVISIIAVLIGVMLPALGSAKGAATVARELANARSLMQGYLAYADEHRGYLLPARIEPGLGPEILHDTPRDHLGNPVTGEPAARFFWRLAPYLEYNFQALYRDQERLESLLESASRGFDPEETSQAYLDYYALTVYPGFGLNQNFVGGKPEYYTPTGAPSNYDRFFGRGFWVARLDDAPDPSGLLAFASSAIIFQNEFIDGYFTVEAPYFTNARWRSFGSPTGHGATPEQFGHVWPVYNTTVVAGFLDGHAEGLGWTDAQDMRLWSPAADAPDWRLTMRR